MRVGWRQCRFRGEGARVRAARAARERKGVIGGKTLETGLPRARTCMRSARRSRARGVRVRSAFLGRFQAHAEALRQGRVRGRVGTADGGRARRAFGCRVSLCTGVHERVAAPRGAPYRRSRHRGGHRGCRMGNETEETNARDATGSRRLEDASTRGRYCRGARPLRRLVRLRLGKRVQKIDVTDCAARCERFGRAAVRGRRLAQWLGIVSGLSARRVVGPHEVGRRHLAEKRHLAARASKTERGAFAHACARLRVSTLHLSVVPPLRAPRGGDPRAPPASSRALVPARRPRPPPRVSRRRPRRDARALRPGHRRRPVAS